MSMSSVSAQEMDDRGYIVKLGQQAPEFEFKLLSDTINNDVLKGKVVVLRLLGHGVVFAEEMPHLEDEVWQRFKENDFILIGLDLREHEATAKEFADAMGVTYPMASDLDGRLFDLLQDQNKVLHETLFWIKRRNYLFDTTL